jgi:hypothetical protein
LPPAGGGKPLPGFGIPEPPGPGRVARPPEASSGCRVGDPARRGRGVHQRLVKIEKVRPCFTSESVIPCVLSASWEAYLEGAPVKDVERVPFAMRTYLFTAVVIIAVLLSPLALFGLSRVGDADLSRMSDVGQAYGFASALISAAALFVVARSFAMQARQSRAAEIQALRAVQAELARLSFDYRRVVAPAFGKSPDDEEYLRNVWRTLMLQYAVAGVDVGEMKESTLREEIAAGLLATEAGRAWWGVRDYRGWSPSWKLVARIFDEEMRRIQSKGETTPGPATDGSTNVGTD